MSLRDQFICFYHTIFCQTPNFNALRELKEDSPWHREESVAIHTDMVVSQYLSLRGSIWSKSDLNGAVAAAFHDIAKPAAREVKFKEEYGGQYQSFKGHEIISARMWEDYVIQNWNYFVDLFDFRPIDIYTVGYLIEHHLPFQVTHPDKRRSLFLTLQHTGAALPFFELIRADGRGRISDDHSKKKSDVEKWINSAKDSMLSTPPLLPVGGPMCHVLIGASGSGKTTFTKNMSVQPINYYSWDDLRLRWYVNGDNSRYEESFQASIQDTTFDERARKEFIEQVSTGNNIIVDNTGLSRKRRAFFVNTARQKGYRVLAHLFPISWSTICERQTLREDKIIALNVAKQQYMSLQLPSYGEFDEIMVHDINIDSE